MQLLMQKPQPGGTSRQNVKRRHMSFTLRLLIIQQLFCANMHEVKYSKIIHTEEQKEQTRCPVNRNVLHEAVTISVVLWNTSLICFFMLKLFVPVSVVI